MQRDLWEVSSSPLMLVPGKAWLTEEAAISLVTSFSLMPLDFSSATGIICSSYWAPCFNNLDNLSQKVAQTKAAQRIILRVMKTDTRKLLFLYPECSSIYKAGFFSYTTQFNEIKVNSLCGNILENVHPQEVRDCLFPVQFLKCAVTWNHIISSWRFQREHTLSRILI